MKGDLWSFQHWMDNSIHTFGIWTRQRKYTTQSPRLKYITHYCTKRVLEEVMREGYLTLNLNHMATNQAVFDVLRERLLGLHVALGNYDWLLFDLWSGQQRCIHLGNYKQKCFISHLDLIRIWDTWNDKYEWGPCRHTVPYTLTSLREESTETMEEIDYANWEEIGRKKCKLNSCRTCVVRLHTA